MISLLRKLLGRKTAMLSKAQTIRMDRRRPTAEEIDFQAARREAAELRKAARESMYEVRQHWFERGLDLRLVPPRNEGVEQT